MAIKLNKAEKYTLADEDFLLIKEKFTEEDKANNQGYSYQTKVNLHNRFNEKEVAEARATINNLVKIGMYTDKQAARALDKYDGGFRNSTIGHARDVINAMHEQGYLTKEIATIVLDNRGRPYKNAKEIKGHFIIRRTEKFFSKLNELIK